MLRCRIHRRFAIVCEIFLQIHCQTCAAGKTNVGADAAFSTFTVFIVAVHTMGITISFLPFSTSSTPSTAKISRFSVVQVTAFLSSVPAASSPAPNPSPIYKAKITSPFTRAKFSRGDPLHVRVSSSLGMPPEARWPYLCCPPPDAELALVAAVTSV